MSPETPGLTVIDGHPIESSWIANKVTVGRYGADFNVIQDAIDYCDAIGGEWTILIYPRGEAGAAVYNEGDITPSGGASITLKGMGEGRVRIAPTVAPAAGVIVSGFTLILEDIIVTAPTNAFPALRIVGGACELCDCELNGVGVGDAIQMVDGTLHLNDSEVPIGDVDLSTAPCTLDCVDTNFGGTIDTAGAVVHTIMMFNCDLGGQTLNLAATGACAYTFHNCMSMSTITDASLLGTGHLCQCDVIGAGLVVTGTSAWIVDNSGTIAVSNTDATTTATIAIYGGICIAITRAIGSVVWWEDGNTLKVIPSGTITDTVIQWAVAAAGAGDTIVVHPGTYQEAVVVAAGVNLVGIDKDNCIINGTAVTLITMAEGCRVANITLNATATGGNAIGIEGNDSAFTLENININLVRTNNNAYAISELTGNTAKVINVRNVRVTSDIDTNEFCIWSNQANKTWYVENCWMQAGDFSLRIEAASTVHSSNNHWESTSGVSAIAINGATVRLHNDVILGTIVITAGVITYKNANQQYEVWAGMLIGDAVTAAAADTPAPSATAPYTVLIHPGVYAESVSMATYVNLKGIGPKGSVVISNNNWPLMTTGVVFVENLTLRCTVSGGLLTASGAGTMRLSDVIFEYTGPAGTDINVFNLGVATTLTCERCSCNITNTAANTRFLYIATNAGTVVRFLDNDFTLNNASGVFFYIVKAATITGKGNRWAGTCAMFNVFVEATTITLDHDSMLCTTLSVNFQAGSVLIARHCDFEERVLAQNTGLVRLKHCSYRSRVNRSGTGDIVDESPEAKDYAFHVVKLPVTSLDNIATRLAVGGAATLGGSGQLVLRLNDNAVDAAGLENNPDAAGPLTSSFTAGRTIRYVRQLSVSVFRATTTAFFGLRATLGAAVPGPAEDHFGFDWDGTNFRAISSDGAGVGQQTNLTTPSTGAQHQLEAIQFNTMVEFYIDGVLVATHNAAAGIPTAGGTLDFQEYQISDGLGGATTSDITLRNGFVQECPA